MKKITFLMSFLMLLSWHGMTQTSTLYLTTSGGSFATEKWVNITDGPNGTGNVLWAQGNGTYGDSQGLVTDEAFVVNDGVTYYINCYDRYADGWDGTTYEIRDAIGGGGLLVADNGGNSPNDLTDNDASSVWETPLDELEVSEAFSYMPPSCPAPSALTATNITATTVDLGWTDLTGSTWDIEYGATPYTPTGTPTVTGTTTNPHNITGLTAQTSYEFYVRTDCGVNGTSNWAGPFAFTTACVTITPNHTEPFATFLPSSCWNEADAGTVTTGPSSLGTSPWTSGTAIGNTARINLYTNTRNDWVLSPLFNLTAGGYEVVIDVAVTNWNSAAADLMGSDDTVKVLYTEDNITWNTLLTFTANNNLPNTLTTFSTLIPSTANNVQFAILATDGPVDNTEDYDFHIDNFIVRTPPTCPDPTALTATNITATTVDLGWTDPTGSTWDIEYGATPFTPTGTPTITGTTTNPHNVTGLTAQTSYEFYVRTDCGVNGTSNWAGPFAFTTACSSVIAPWNEDFENAGTIPACWNQGTSNSENWLFANTGSGNHIGNNGTMGGATTSGNYFAWVDDSSPDNTGTTLESPFIDVSALTVPELSFFLISNNEGNSNVDFSVDVWDGAAWNVAHYSHNTNTMNGEWEKITVNLSALTITGDLKLRFVVDEPSNGDFYDDVAIDDVDIHEAPLCPDPTMLTATNITATTADLGWTDPTGSTWDIEYGATPFTPTGTPTITGTTTNPHNLTGLTAQTSYEFYVRADCGVDSSNWVGPFAFTTACASFVAPYLEQFNVASLPACWSESGANTWEYGSNVTTPTGFADYGADNVPDHSTPGTGTFIGMDGSDNTDGEVSVLLSPFIDASPLTTPHLSYWVFSNNIDDAAQNKLIVELWDGTAWNFIDSIQSNLGTSWVNFDTVLTSLTITGDVQVRFTITGVANGGNTFYNDILIDDVQIYEPLTNDIGVIAIESAPAGCGLGNETVTIKVKNYGVAAETGFDVAYALNSVAITPETVSATVNPGDTLTYVFTTLANMSTANVYTIDAWTDLSTDGDNNNDTLTGWVTEHLASSLAFSGNMAIPDNNTTGVNSIICTDGLVNNMLDSCYTLSALVIDSLVHTWNSDIDMWLISPAGDTLEVSTDNGSSTDNYINVRFTDTASVNINGNNPVPGAYHTEELVGLAKFMGTDPNGAWTLLVKDDSGGDTGVLYDWHLEFTDHNFTVDLGVDTNLCPNQSITLDAGAGNYAYSWSTGDNTQQVTLDTNTLGGNGTYNITVTVTDTISGCATIDTIVVDFSPCSGINTLANNVNVNVYPNPNNGQFTLNVNTADVNEMSIRVVNLQGQEVYNRNNFENLNTVNEQIDLSNNANGIYFVIVTTDKGIVTHKMIVQ